MTHPDAQAAPGPHEAQEHDPRGRGAWVWGVTAALAVVVLGAAGTVIAVDAQSNNRGEVRNVATQYLDAVAGGRLAEAERLFDGAPSAASGGAPSADVFAEAEHIAHPELERFRVDFDGGRATGEVVYELDGYPYTDHLELRRGADDTWSVTSGLRYDVMLDTAGGGALGLHGADEPFPAEADYVTLYAGQYALESHNPYFATLDGARFPVTSAGDALFASDWVVPGPDYAEEVQRKVAEAYRACATSTDVWELQSCGIDAMEPSAKFDPVASVTVSVEMVTPPLVSSVDEASTWMQIEERGEFTATYTGRGADGRPVTETLEVGASDADVEVTPTTDGLDVEIYAY